MSHMSIRQVATTACAAIAVFPAVVVSLNLVQHASYDPKVQAISELALGRGGALMVVAFLSLGSGIALLAHLLGRTCTRGRSIRGMLYLAAVLAGPMSAFFHTDLTGHPTTTHGTIHNDAGLAAFLIILVSMHVAAWRFRRQPAWRAFAAPTLLWAVAATAAFFLIPALPAHFGVAQRIFVGTFVSWLLAATAYARQIPLPVEDGTVAAAPVHESSRDVAHLA
jgi:hypothetical protein